jgi:hypothetical protein
MQKMLQLRLNLRKVQKKTKVIDTGLKVEKNQVLLPHAYNCSYSGGRDQEDCGLKTDLGK